jgi:hypothetical protein
MLFFLVPIAVIIGALLFPPVLLVLGFSSIGPAAGSFAAWGIGGVGGGALYLWSILQSIAMIPLAALKLGAIIGGVVGSLVAFFY